MSDTSKCPDRADGTHRCDSFGHCTGLHCTFFDRSVSTVGATTYSTAVQVASDDLAPARVGAMLIWRGMVKFPLQRGWVWLKPGPLPVGHPSLPRL